MKNYKNYLKLFNVILFSLLLTSCFESDEDFGADAGKAVATIFDFAGETLVNVNDVKEFSVTPRAGSTFTWEATGAVIEPIAGTTHKVNVNFNQEGAATVSVFETTSAGAVSATTSQTVNVLNLCDWKIEMQDFYQDGWNKAYVEVSFVGGATIDPVKLELADGGSGSQTFSVPSGYEVKFTFVSGDWDEEISYQIYDASGTKIFEDGDQTGSATPTVGLVHTTTATCP